MTGDAVAGAPGRLDTDVLVIGAGVAGLCAALSAGSRRVTLVCPDEPIRASSSALAQGGIAAPLGADDSPELHIEDTLVASDYSADPAVVDRVIRGAVGAIGFLEGLGVVFDRNRIGRSLHLEAGHSRPRVAHAAGDRSGATLVTALWAAQKRAPHVDALRGWRAVDLIPGNGDVSGAVVANGLGQQCRILARDTVLATGGVGQLFELTTNGPDATGDGLAMACAAGAQVAALEFVQFHPTALNVAADPLPLLTEALRGAGARLVTADGQLIMSGRHRLGDLAPRDVVARAVYEHTTMGRAVFLDARALFRSPEAAAFPGARETARRFGVDPAEELLPVTAAAHYHMGGVAVDDQGRTSIPRLWACGEVACTGLHGANRLASNSLLEAIVFGCAVGTALSASPSQMRDARVALAEAEWRPGESPVVGMPLRRLLWSALGPVRDGAMLHRAIKDVRAARASADAGDRILQRRLDLALMMLAAAATREESRGAHWRADFPARDSRRDGASATALLAKGPDWIQ
jgi:L-aspartate oxidase